MRLRILILACFLSSPAFSQSLQLHYDFRHSFDPLRNARNFPSLVFDEWKSQDYGSFDFKAQADLSGDRNNIGQVYIQAQQSLKFWKPAVYLFMQYSGGIGVADPGLYGYHIPSAFSFGLSYLFLWEGAWFSPSLVYQFTDFERPSHDPMYSLYWGKDFLNGMFAFKGDFEIWTLNRNHGDASTTGLSGKRILFYAEPQIWINITKQFSVGTKINVYYHVVTSENLLLAYPTAAVAYMF